MGTKRPYNEILESVNKRIKKDVFVPFRIHIPAGESTFDVPVPRIFQDKLFYFSYLVLVPEFYSNQAQKFDLDTDEELDQLLNYETFMKIDFDNPRLLYPDAYVPSKIEPNLVAMAQDINNFWEVKKPEGTLRTGFFFDWFDEFFDPSEGLTWDQYVRDHALTWYEEEFDVNKHFNALPVSARDLPGVNNYLFPTTRAAAVLENLRFRMNIAPNMKPVFSTFRQLEKFGFDFEDQLEPAKKGQQYMFPNAEPMKYFQINAYNEPKFDDEFPVDLKMSIRVNNIYFISRTIDVAITKRDTVKNANYATAIKKVLNQFADACNIMMDILYDPAAKEFTFVFPTNNAFRNLTFTVHKDLSLRLGYGMERDIKISNKTGKKVEDEPDVTHIQERARALAYDTSVVIVSDENTSSISTYGISEKFMAALYPTNTGTLEIPESDLCYDPPVMNLKEIHRHGKSSEIKTTFRLSRFLDNSELINLVWKNGAFVYGVLRGVPI